MSTNMGWDQCISQLQMKIPANVGFMALVSEGLRAVFEQAPDMAEKESILYNVQLAVQEACTNIIDHAYGMTPADETHAIEIEICLEPGQIMVQLEDTGTAFTLPEAGSIELPIEPQEHGYGLFLMYSLVDEVSYQPRKEKNRWVLVKRFTGAGGAPAPGHG